jgi:hypothetical protein
MKKTIILIFMFSIFGCDKECIETCSIEGRWHLTGFETNTMYVFNNDTKYTIYSQDGTFGGLEDAIPNPQPYLSSDDGLTLDFGENSSPSVLDFKCDCDVVDVRSNDVVWVWWREGYNVEDCNE